MIKNKFIYIIALVSIIITSCKTVHKITDKDNSTNTISRKKATRKVVFMEGIEVTPGSVVKSKHKPATTKYSSSGKAMNEPPKNLPANSKIEIEKSNAIQIKYAILLDTYIENITNLNLFNDIEEWWGTNYCLGGTTKNCIDCSAFTGTIVRDVYKINLPRTASEQHDATSRVKKDDLKEGDLVFFRTKKGYINHVGVYLANNKFVHASTSNGVMISDLDESYWRTKFVGGGRVID